MPAIQKTITTENLNLVLNLLKDFFKYVYKVEYTSAQNKSTNMTFFISNVKYKLDKMNGIGADSGTKNLDFDDFFKDLKKVPLPKGKKEKYPTISCQSENCLIDYIKMRCAIANLASISKILISALSKNRYKILAQKEINQSE